MLFSCATVKNKSTRKVVKTKLRSRTNVSKKKKLLQKTKFVDDKADQHKSNGNEDEDENYVKDKKEQQSLNTLKLLKELQTVDENDKKISFLISVNDDKNIVAKQKLLHYNDVLMNEENKSKKSGPGTPELDIYFNQTLKIKPKSINKIN